MSELKLTPLQREVFDMKQQISREIAADFVIMEKAITANIKKYIDESTVKIMADLKKQASTQTVIQTQIATLKSEQTEKLNSQLQIYDADNEKNILAITKQVSAQLSVHVASRVFAEVEKKIQPQIDCVREWVAYNTEDTDGLIDQFRRAVEKQDDQPKLLENGTKDARVISKGVKLAFDPRASDDW